MTSSLFTTLRLHDCSRECVGQALGPTTSHNAGLDKAKVDSVAEVNGRTAFIQRVLPPPGSRVDAVEGRGRIDVELPRVGDRCVAGSALPGRRGRVYWRRRSPTPTRWESAGRRSARRSTGAREFLPRATFCIARAADPRTTLSYKLCGSEGRGARGRSRSGPPRPRHGGCSAGLHPRPARRW